MQRRDQRVVEGFLRTAEMTVSRRAAVRSSGLALFGLLSGAALGRAQEEGRYRPAANREMPEHMRRQAEESRAFMERLRNAGSMEERMKIMAERSALQRKQAVEDLKDQLGVSDREWPVIKARIEVVYDLVHPQRQSGPGAEPRTEVERRRGELREVLRDDAAAVDEIKAKLTPAGNWPPRGRTCASS